jgi:hypothetical protein
VLIMATVIVGPWAAPTTTTPTRSVARSASGFLGLGGLRLTRRGRLVTVLLALAVAVPTGVFGAQAVAGTPAEAVEVQLHTVAPGETLWQFARNLAAPGQDLREVVRDLRELNGMETSALRAGQVVAIPRG